MNKKQFLKLVQYAQASGGATLNHKGDLMTFGAGFMVSLLGYEKQLNINSLTVKDLNTYLKLAKRLSAFVGLWIDNNILYLDISIKIDDIKQALKTASDNKQLAIYDLRKQASIYFKDVDAFTYEYTYNYN